MTNSAVAPTNAAQAAYQSSGNTSTSSTSSASAAQLSANNTLASLAGNFQSFLTLLTTQLKNQDPTSPLDTSQFTQQITQMTGVEQQLLSNQLLQQLVSTQGSVASSANLLGDTITAPGATSSDPNISGVVTAVTNYDGQTMLTVGDNVVPISDVISISQTPSTSSTSPAS